MRLCLAILIAVSAATLSQSAEDEVQTIELSPEQWTADGAQVEFGEYLGRRAVRISGGELVLENFAMQDGVVEFDVAIEETRGFAGINFRRVDDRNHESFYLRSHQSGNPDANQYTPVFNGTTGWQIYYGPQYATPVEYRFDAWMSLRLSVSGDEAEIHLDGKPVLRTQLRRSAKSGGIALWTNVNAAWFSNVRISHRVPDLQMEALPAGEKPAGLVSRWEISDPFDWADVASVELAKGLLEARSWTSIDVEPNGVANIARVADRRDGDTVLARLTVPSKEAGRFQFGFTRQARVFVDERLAYEGRDGYASRDYRFLGTVGLFDSVFPESPTSSETATIVLAVRRGIGGWGVMGALPESVPIRESVVTVRGEKARKLHEQLREEVRNGFGGAVVVAESGEITLESGYGFADRQNEIPFTSETFATTGSLSKQFTAMAIVDLALDGKVRFDAPLGEYLTTALEPVRKVTLHQLMTHSGGVTEYCGQDFEPMTRRQLIETCTERKLRFDPGSDVAYSNPAFSLLAAVVEVASGMPYETYLQTKLFAPNGMSATGFAPPDGASVARGYLRGVDQGDMPSQLAPLGSEYWSLKGNGAVQSTARDMFRWYEALSGRRELTSAHVDMATKPRVEQTPTNWQAYGWNAGRDEEGNVIRVSHSGSNGVYFAYFWWNPKDDRFFYIIGNNGEEPLIEVTRTILRHVN